jgi:hypothetical protein
MVIHLLTLLTKPIMSIKFYLSFTKIILLIKFYPVHLFYLAHPAYRFNPDKLTPIISLGSPRIRIRQTMYLQNNYLQNVAEVVGFKKNVFL